MQAESRAIAHDQSSMDAPSPPSTPPGPDLITAARSGDANAYRALFDLHAGAIRAFGRLRGAEDPDDFANAVLFDAFRGLQQFTGDLPAFRGWVFRIARNALIDEYRRRARRPQLTAETVPPQPSPSADAVVLSSAEHAIAHPLLDTLTDEQREVLILRFVLDLSIEETATALGLPVTAVKARQRRAIAAARRRIELDP